ncbi:MAG: GAF domain-containing protein [Chloroflexi bacterium]|nr:GAF domain-containing protein [Chloroflexota bacterium]
MRRLSQIGLAWRITLSVALGLGLILVMFGLVASWTVQQSTEAAYRERLVLAKAMASYVDGALLSALSDLEQTSAQLGLGEGEESESELRRSLAKFISGYGPSSSVAFLDTGGTVVVTEPRESETVGASLLDRPGASEALASGTPHLAGFLPSAGRYPFLALAVPVFGQGGKIIGVLAAELDPRHGQFNMLPLAQIEDEAEVQVIDTSGAVVVEQGGESEGYSSLSHVALLASLMANEQAGVRLHEPVPNQSFASHLVAYAPVARMPRWGVVVEQPEDIALAMPRQLQRRLFLFGMLALLVAIAFAWLDARRIVRPLRVLTGVAERFAAGELERPVPVERGDELGVLARAFETMRVRLKASMGEIEHWNKELESRVAARTEEVEQRNRQLAAVNALATTVSGSLEMKQVLQRALDWVLEFTGLEVGGFRLLDEETQTLRLAAQRRLPESIVAEPVCSGVCLCGRAAKSGVPMVVSDLSVEREAFLCHQAGLGSVVVIPLLAQQRVLGILYLGSKTPQRFDQRMLGTLSAMGRQVGLALANARLYEELQRKEQLRAELLQQVITAQEGERKRIARDLHDSTAQSLTAITMGLELLAESMPPDSAALQRFTRMQELAASTLTDLRSLIFDLRPAALDDLGLVPALRACARQHLGDRDVRVTIEGIGLKERLPSQHETCLFRVLQEAITNTAKHAQAKSVRIRLERTDGKVVALVEDDGVGFALRRLKSEAEPGRGFGLLDMRERAELLGGTVRVESLPGAGTRIRVELPLDRSDPL